MFGVLLMVACTGVRTAVPTDSGAVADGGAVGADGGAAAAPAPLLLALPLAEPDRFEVVLGVDHDPTVQEDTPLGRLTCLDYVGRSFPHCYDEHDGTDYILAGGFSAMDAGSTPVVAAADGVVTSVEDGHYDRCHGDLETGDVSCDGHDGIANHVIVEHVDAEGGRWQTMYWHLKQDSTAVAEGDTVAAGTPLGLVGSSGYSTLPHLHLELQRFDGAADDGAADDWLVVDPYAGPYSQELSYWCDQGDEDGLPGGCS